MLELGYLDSEILTTLSAFVFVSGCPQVLFQIFRCLAVNFTAFLAFYCLPDVSTCFHKEFMLV